jgi:UDP-glucose 4-epimerase
MSDSGLAQVVILGDSGFVGSALRRHLQQTNAPVIGFSSAELDLRNAERMSRLCPVIDSSTTLVVLAAIAPPRGLSFDGLADNLAMSVNLARAITECTPGLTLYFSSDAVYADQEAPITEDAEPRPSNMYSIAKHTTERVLSVAAARSGVPLIVVRPTVMYGPGDTHGSYGPNRFVHTIAAEGSVRLFGKGEEQRDHLYIDDAVNLTVALAARGQPGVFNLATGGAELHIYAARPRARRHVEGCRRTFPWEVR